MSEKILFIDRDGTLIKESKEDFQADSLEELASGKGAIPTLLRLQKFGFSFALVSNQDGLGTESFPKENFEKAHSKVLEILQSCGIIFKDIFICPHFEKKNRACRKPKTALLEDYIKYHLYDKEQSFVIGDRQSDIDLASNLGLSGLKYGELSWEKVTEQTLNSFRCASVRRKTRETDISVRVVLNGDEVSVKSGVAFLDHMIEQIAVHSDIELELSCRGDLEIDEHHSVEDIALALGGALKRALGDRVDIARYGFILPMDESLANCVLDFSNRPFLKFKAKFKKRKLGILSTGMVEHFFYSLSYALGVSLHLKVKGKNDHHKCEALFKAFARVLKQATKIESKNLTGSKGVL